MPIRRKCTWLDHLDRVTESPFDHRLCVREPCEELPVKSEHSEGHCAVLFAKWSQKSQRAFLLYGQEDGDTSLEVPKESQLNWTV